MSISNRLCFSECSVEEIVPNDPDADCDREDLDDVVLFGSDHLRRPSVANMSDLELIAY